MDFTLSIMVFRLTIQVLAALLDVNCLKILLRLLSCLTVQETVGNCSYSEVSLRTFARANL